MNHKLKEKFQLFKQKLKIETDLIEGMCLGCVLPCMDVGCVDFNSEFLPVDIKCVLAV